MYLNKDRVKRSNRKRGYRFENKTANMLKKNPDNKIVIRSSGSLGIADVIVCDNDKVRLIQNKTNGYLSPDEREAIYKFLVGVSDIYQFEVWYYISKKKVKKHIIKKAHEKTTLETIKKRLLKHAKIVGYQKKKY